MSRRVPDWIGDGAVPKAPTIDETREELGDLHVTITELTRRIDHGMLTEYKREELIAKRKDVARHKVSVERKLNELVKRDQLRRAIETTQAPQSSEFAEMRGRVRSALHTLHWPTGRNTTTHRRRK